jgi:hypothetical protein
VRTGAEPTAHRVREAGQGINTKALSGRASTGSAFFVTYFVDIKMDSDNEACPYDTFTRFRLSGTGKNISLKMADISHEWRVFLLI